MRGETLICVCSYGCVVGPLITGLYKLSGGSGRRHAVGIPASLRKMVFVIPEMPTKTFFMVLKKLPDHFKYLCLDLLSILSGIERLFSVSLSFAWTCLILRVCIFAAARADGHG